MQLKILIRHNATGEVRECGPFEYDNLGQAIYQWEEGNDSCDCNRSIFFMGTGYSNIRCSAGAYSVRIFTENGNEIYSEYEDAPCH